MNRYEFATMAIRTKSAASRAIHARPSPRQQRGAATLVITLILLLAMTSLALMANKSVSFEHKTSGNYYRHTQAFDAAEAGLDRAVARLQMPSLRAPYIDSVTGLVVTANASTQTQMGDLAFRFVLTNPVPANPNLVEITSHGYADGCTTFDNNCAVRAQVGQRVLFRPLAPASLDAPLITRGPVAAGGNAQIINSDVATGYTIRAGGTVTLGGSANLTTPTGTLGNGVMDASVTASDAGLAGMTNDAFIESIFGDSKATLRLISEQFTCSGVDCNAKLDGINGRPIWVDGDVHLNANTAVGTAADPVILFVNGNFQLNGNAQIYGIVYAIGAQAVDASGNPTLHGVLLSETSLNVTGRVTLQYDPAVLAALSRFGTYSKVAGTWSDF